MTFARRLVAGMILVLLVTVLVLVVAAERWLRTDLERDVRVGLERHASLSWIGSARRETCGSR
jgi:ABC-type uncharacterized transport system fused permease/ATPase subunit